MKKKVTLLICCTAIVVFAAPKPAIVRSENGQLAYYANEHGDRVPDFSTCGYAGGDKQIPNAPVRVVVAPIKGDETARIQRALNYVASLPADKDGIRGAVLLLRGRHEVLGGLQITNSGVVLRGQGMGEDGTRLIAAGLDRRTLIRVFGRDDRQTGESIQVTDDYIPVGATSFHLKSNDLISGDPIRLIRPSTVPWIERLGATEFGGGEGGGWKPGSRDIVWDFKVKSIQGDLVTIDSPITTGIERESGAHVETCSWPGRISDVGIENLSLESTFDVKNPKDENHSWCAITMENVANAWVRQVTFKHFAGSAVAIYETSKCVTAEDCLSLAPVSEDGGYRRNTFFTMGQQTLFLRCWSEHGRHDFSVGHCAPGPNAFVQCEAVGALADSGPIESWASGVLYDCVRIDANALMLGYRPGNNAGIGWSAANFVLWNCTASLIRCWNPPGAQNWSFGSWASFEGDGIWLNSNGFMRPESLYLAQLADRRGRDAAARVAFMSRSTAESTNPSLEQAAKLSEEARNPAPRLSEFIVNASMRDPISIEPGNARRVEDILSGSSRGNEAQTSTPQKSQSLLTSAATKLIITNGWLTRDGKLLIGDTMDLAWWRGNIRPGEAASFGPALTRFVPGRIGRGFTDDLTALADSMEFRGAVALNHHYGLWYERRRDDHERVRRLNGDVLPPFFEQPFARSGQGVAWDGLSRYDLKEFNPWYWSRLKNFADICDQRGLILFNQNYFQHNIIEAGAHWVDCPWRTANNINNTGFPEPPQFAGDKRIFMAEQFYDVTHPARRRLHENFIRQNLENFKTNSNVIQFTSAEFTGPKHFVEFWLDTIRAWEKQNRKIHPLIALSCTKDVQGAILADKQRSAVVDLIDFRYWWRTDKGEFAPEGGKNLAPRQWERQWKGGRPNDANLAGMAAEYRGKYPNKPVICNFDGAGWAWVCAGGSLPNLPQTTDKQLLAAIPRMQPWVEGSKSGRWALQERGKQFLIYSQDESDSDLVGVTGAFHVRTVNPQTGKTTTQSETIQAGSKVKLPKGIVWLTR